MNKQLDDIAKGLQDSNPLTAQYLNGIFGLAKKLSFQMSTNHAVDTYEDFFQVLLLEACKLEKKFDKSRGTSFYTFINRPLKAKAFREFVPVDRSTDSYKDIKTFVKDYESKHGTYPQVAIISEGTGYEAGTVKEIYYGKTQQVSLEALSEDYVSSLGDKEVLSPLDFLEDLDDLEASVISLMYGDVPEETAEAFAMNYLCITKSALQSIHDRALSKLKESMLDYA